MSQFSKNSKSLLTKSIFDNSIIRITSASPENKHFGNGFVIKRDEIATYILTCAQVIRAVGGIDQVKVANQIAVVIAYCEDNHFNSLAVLRVEKKLGDIILPLGESGVSGSHFIALGHQANSTEIKIELIKGYLEKLVRQKRRNLLNCSYIWQLKISDEFTLGTGFIGAPVIDIKSFTVLGVISQQEDRSQEIQAVSIAALKNIWLDIPTDLLRKKIYDLEKINNRLNFIFKDNEQLSNYFSGRFPIIFRDKDIPFLPRLYYLINYCNHQNLLDDLIGFIKESFNQNSNYKLVDTSTTIRKSNKVTFCKIILSRFFTNCKYFNFFNVLTKKTVKQKISQCEITFSLDYSKCSHEILHATIHALAGSLNLSRDEITILDVRLGSVIVKIEIPPSALDKLISLFESDKYTVRQLGILYVAETFDEKLILGNIQTLLVRSYTEEEILTIYQKYFENSLREELINVEKSKIVDDLIYRLNQKSLISKLLSSINKQKPEAYDKFKPYFKIPRRSSKENKQRVTSHLTLCEKIKGGFSGTGVTVFGFILLFILDFLVSDSLPEQFSPKIIFSTIIWLCLIPLGSLVGKVVAKAIGRRVGDAVGRLAATTFSIGTIGLPLGLMTLLIIFYIRPESKEEIIRLLIYPFFNPDYPFDSLLKIIGFSSGSHSAYQNAMDYKSD